MGEKPWRKLCYIPEPIRKSAGGFKKQNLNLLKTNTPKQTVYGEGQKISKPGNKILKKLLYEQKRKKFENRIIRGIQILFETEEVKEERKKHKNNERLIKDKIIRDTMTLFEQQKGYYKPKRVSSSLSNNCIEYESNGDKNSNLSLDKFLNKVKSYLRDIIIYLQSSDAWKIQLTIAINFIFLKDTGEESVMHSTSDNIKFRPYNDECQVVNELFESLRSKYQDNLEISMRGSDLIFDSVQLMYYNPANICWSSTRLQRNNFF